MHRGARKIAYGEITVALALSQQLVKRDKTTPQKAVDCVLEVRRVGPGLGRHRAQPRAQARRRPAARRQDRHTGRPAL